MGGAAGAIVGGRVEAGGAAFGFADAWAASRRGAERAGCCGAAGLAAGAAGAGAAGLPRLSSAPWSTLTWAAAGAARQANTPAASSVAGRRRVADGRIGADGGGMRARTQARGWLGGASV